MKNRILKIVNFFIFLGLGIVLLFLAFRGVKFNELMLYFREINYGWVLVTLIFGTISHISRAYRWTLLIRPLGFQPKVSNSFYAVMIGYIANIAFPRLGEITRCGVLSRREKIPFESLVGTVIIERAFDLLTFVCLIILVVFIEADRFGKFIRDFIIEPLFNRLSSIFTVSPLIWIALLLFIIALIVFYRLFRKQIAEIPVFRKMKDMLKGIILGIKAVFNMQGKRWFLLHTVIIWVMYWAMSYFISFALPNVADFKPIDGLFLLVVGTFGMTAPVQGGFGAFHYFVTLGLTMLYGLSREQGLAYATISHESQTLLLVILGALSLVLMFLSGQKKSNEQPGVHKS